MTLVQEFEDQARGVSLPPVCDDSRLRVAIVGCGPKGMYCLERLAAKLNQAAFLSNGEYSRRVEVTVFEASHYPGAGNVYDPRQPHYLRMNFAVDQIDAWPPRLESRTGQPSLLEWLEVHHPHLADPTAFIPRAIVGDYLHDCFCTIRRELEQLCDVRIVCDRVCDVRPVGSDWIVTTTHSSLTFDVVMLTVGHEGWRPSDARLSSGIANCVEKVFPVGQHLSEARVPPQSVVMIRGFGLTCIDAILALTEGRGGEFGQEGAEWRYTSSGTEPRSILPFSRSGRPMLAKPMSGREQLPQHADRVWTAQRERLAQLSRPAGGFDFLRDLWPVIVDTADQIPGSADGCGVASWFDNWRHSTFDAAEAERAMRTSLDVASGARPPDAAWALGEAWRKLYPALVDQISHAGLAQHSWRDFWPIAAEMEKIAFGPPAENLGRILALVDSGIVDLCNVSAHSNAKMSFDRIVNAVLPSPRDLAHEAPLSRLLRAGIIRRMSGAGGIDVDEAGRPTSPEGDPVEGLAVIGRATEGCILGNDTLSRTLHSHADRWAERICKRHAIASP